MKNFTLIKLATYAMLCVGTLTYSCGNSSVSEPVYTLPEPFTSDGSLSDAAFQYIDGNVIHGKVTLYAEDGSSRTFVCVIGGSDVSEMDHGCRLAYSNGRLYNLDRNKWVTIDGVRYRASNLLD